MAASELSLEQIRDYFLKNGGTVENRDAVRHFRKYLTDPASKDDARLKFKKYINILATTKSDGDLKVLTLRPRFINNSFEQSGDVPQVSVSPKYDPRNSIGIPVNSVRTPPPYRPPPPVPSPNNSFDTVSISSSNISFVEHSTPQAPPRRRSTDKIKLELSDMEGSDPQISNNENEEPENVDKQISVKERTQKFNKLASYEDESLSPKSGSNNKSKRRSKGSDDVDGSIVTSLEPKLCTAWYVAAAKGDYQELAKLASKHSSLVKLKDPFTAYTVLHWGAKHGNVDVIKLFAGTYKVDVNAKTNGGSVPLHLAAQFGHDDVFKTLVEVYKANSNVRDFSGKKPDQYKKSYNHVKPKTTNSEYSTARPIKHARKPSFLRKSFTQSHLRLARYASETSLNKPNH